MINYAQPLASDKSGNAWQNSPSPVRALSRIASENGTVSSVISLGHDTTVVEVAAVGGAAAMRWVATTDTTASLVTVAGATSNFDHIIGTGTVRRFVVPRETAGFGGQGSVVGINREAGLYQRVAIKSMGISSVLLAEY